MADEEKNPKDAVEEFMNLLGGKQEAEAFMAEVDKAATKDAFKGLREMYGNLREAGFKRSESLEFLAYYLIKVITGDEE